MSHACSSYHLPVRACQLLHKSQERLWSKDNNQSIFTATDLHHLLNSGLVSMTTSPGHWMISCERNGDGINIRDPAKLPTHTSSQKRFLLPRQKDSLEMLLYLGLAEKKARQLHRTFRELQDCAPLAKSYKEHTFPLGDLIDAHSKGLEQRLDEWDIGIASRDDWRNILEQWQVEPQLWKAVCADDGTDLDLWFRLAKWRRVRFLRVALATEASRAREKERQRLRAKLCGKRLPENRDEDGKLVFSSESESDVDEEEVNVDENDPFGEQQQNDQLSDRFEEEDAGEGPYEETDDDY